MPEHTPQQEFATAFRAELRATLLPAIEAAAEESRLAEEAMLRRWQGYRMTGVSWPTSSHGISTDGSSFRFHMPTKLADERNVALVEEAIATAEEKSGLSFDGRRVRGGSNYVVEGRLEPTPEAAFGPGL